MKKSLICLLTMLLITMFGCSSTTKSDDVPNDTPADNDEVSEVVADFSLGYNENNVYHSDFLGLTITLNDDWMFYTNEQILQLNNLTADLVEDEIAQILKEADLIYDMYATHLIDGSVININLQKFNSLLLKDININDVLEPQIDTITSSYQSMGFTDIVVEMQKMIIDGIEFDGFKLSSKYDTVDIYAAVVCYVRGDYIVTMSLGSQVVDNIDAILDCFDYE